MDACCVLGALLGWLRARAIVRLAQVARFDTNICRKVPSFVLLFNMAPMMPGEVTAQGMIMTGPLWIKAMLALTFPVIGFTPDRSRGYFEQQHAGVSDAKETFLIVAAQYFLIIIKASVTASVTEVDEVAIR